MGLMSRFSDSRLVARDGPYTSAHELHARDAVGRSPCHITGVQPGQPLGSARRASPDAALALWARTRQSDGTQHQHAGT